MKRGTFIVLYGINNIGKTVQSKRLTLRLRKAGKKAIFVKYPIYSEKPTGPLLDKILRSGKKQKISEEELQLLFVLNRYQFQPKLLKLIAKGYIVVAEDYRFTGVAWGTAKGAHLQELIRMNQFLLSEDLAILLEGKRRLSAKEKGHLHEENHALVMKCARVFQKLARKYQWKRVKVSSDKDDTEERIWKIMKRFIKIS